MGSCVKKQTTISTSRVVQLPEQIEKKNSIFSKPNSGLNSVLTANLSTNMLKRGSLVLPAAVPEGIMRRASLNILPRRQSASNIVTKNEVDIKLIKTALQKHFIFSNLLEGQINAIAEEMQQFVFPSQTIIFEQNSIGDNFFVIAKGKVEVNINLKSVATLAVGDSFGEVALLHDTPRTATIITIAETTLWGLDRLTFRGVLQNMNIQKYSENLIFIENITIFKALTKKQKESLANAMINETFKPGTRILREGDSGDFMFVIKDGSVIVTKQGVEIRKLTKNDYFGEQALLNDFVRTATVTALDSVKCLSINSEGLYSVLGNHLKEIIHMNTQRMAIDNNPILSKLTPTQITNFLLKAEVKIHNRGSIIKQAGKLLDDLIIVLQGMIGNRNLKLKALEILGIDSLLHKNNVILDNLVAVEDSNISCINIHDIETAIGGRVEDVIEMNQIIKIIKDIKLFRGLEQNILEKMVKMLNIARFRSKDVIFKQGQPGESFFIIKSGNVEVIKNGIFVRNISKFDYFGERSILFNIPRSATIRALDDIECWTLTKSQFSTIVDDSIKNLLLDRVSLQDDKIEMPDLYALNILSQGKLANVFLCMSKKNSKLYVLKTMQKTKVISMNMQTSVVSQKKILSQLDHNFIVKMVKTFKDSLRLSILMEFVDGVEFSVALKTLKNLDELDSRFYTGCFMLILEYLHEHEIIHRELILRQFVIDAQGYPKLIDLACAKYLQGRTYTIVGSPHYLSPEAVSGNGYGFASDLWTLGITLYEMMYHTLPFGANESDPIQIYQIIINHRLTFPSTVSPLSKSRDIISILLNKTPSQRGTIEKLKAHPWFVGLNWSLLINKQIKAPFLPVMKDHNEEIRSALKVERQLSDMIPKFEKNLELYIPRFGVNSKWDADF